MARSSAVKENAMSRIVVGMSGGVDSAVTAYLLKCAGHEVIGVTLKTWLNDSGEVSRCCEIDDAHGAALAMDIPFYTVNCASEFRANVIKPFINDYLGGKTPSPCVVCNRTVKWAKMLEFADSMNADYIATGHYASVIRLENGRYTVKAADSSEKAQAYMLYRLSQEQLARTIMPLGKLTKAEVREIAASAGLPVAAKADSQEICFITHGTYSDYIEENCEGYTPNEGDFVDEQGNVLGRHKGIIHYTVGQRRGLGVAMGYPVFVKRIDAEKNEVVLARDEELYGSRIICGDLNFQSIPDIAQGERIEANVRIRYKHAGEKAVIERLDEERVAVTFAAAVRAAAPGQSAVFYDNDGCVIGGGVIER